MALGDGQGCTVVHSFCSECALSPRAEAPFVRLFGRGGFPVRLFWQCVSCSSEFVAVQGGAITAWPLEFSEETTVRAAPADLGSSSLFLGIPYFGVGHCNITRPQ